MAIHWLVNYCLGLVREVDRDVDPHEGKEWFYANISKEQAFNFLSAGKCLWNVRCASCQM